MIIMCSSCILGLKTRYSNKTYNNIVFSKKHIVIPFCPEQFSALKTPRLKSTLIYEIENIFKYSKGIIDEKNTDITKKFISGAQITLNIVKNVKPDLIILKENSPSCGLNFTSINWKKQKGIGVCAYLLKKQTNIKLISF